MLRTLTQAAAISFFALSVSSSTLAVQLSGIVANQNGDTVAATVYVNGNVFATADVDGYFAGDIAAGASAPPKAKWTRTVNPTAALCRDFANGKCKRGISCTYHHPSFSYKEGRCFSCGD